MQQNMRPQIKTMAMLTTRAKKKSEKNFSVLILTCLRHTNRPRF